MKTILNQDEKLINIINENLSNTVENKVSEKYILNNIEIYISGKQLKILNKLKSSIKTRLDIKRRIKIIINSLKSDIKKCKKELPYDLVTTERWLIKWKQNESILKRIEEIEPHNLKKTVLEVLSDKYRSGKPSKLKNEQIATIIFLSLQTPEKFNIPRSNWTAEVLKKVCVEIGVIKENDISPRQINRYLKNIDIKLHAYTLWLNSIESNPDIEEYKNRVKRICEVYINSENLGENGTVIISTDEKTGIQAIEHKHPLKPALPGSHMKIEQEYKRNGTTTLIASRDVNTVKVIPMLNPTRNELDFANHIKDVIKKYDVKRIIFIMDQLNTHMSETLVKLIAKECDIAEYLGIKGKEGILKSMKTRKEFLEISSHKIQILYNPKHCSWLNQIELWFGILTKQLLNKRRSFRSVDELNIKILEYVEYYNSNLAKKFKWNYSGKILNI